MSKRQGFNEGILVESRSIDWDESSLINEILKLNKDVLLVDISGEPHKKSWSEARRPDDLLPSSVLIIRERALDELYAKIETIFSGHDFPSMACFIILKEWEHNSVPKQLIRDNVLTPEVASNSRDLKQLIRSHLSDLDPGAPNGLSNLRTFEEQVNAVTEEDYDIVPDSYRDENT